MKQTTDNLKKVLADFEESTNNHEKSASALEESASILREELSCLVDQTERDHSLYCDQHTPYADTWPLDIQCPECRMVKIGHLVGELNWALRRGQVLKACYFGEALELALDSMSWSEADPEALELGRKSFEGYYEEQLVDPLMQDELTASDLAIRAFYSIVEATAKDVL